MTSFEASRSSYERSELLEGTVAADPLVQLRAWLDEAYAAEIKEANAMCVATVDASGAPSARMVLLRGLDTRGIMFYTSYFSRKGRDISGNANVAATFYWAQLERQVRVEGRAVQLSEDESDAYFDSRPRGHRLSAWASEQSQPVDDRSTLDDRMHHFSERFEDEEVPRPHSWGGYLIEPVRIEFWQGRQNRMHDRLLFEREARAWKVVRLQP